MTRRLYLEPEQFRAAEVRLTGAPARRLVSVLRLRAGAELRVFDGLGAERRATVARTGRATATLELGAAVEPLPEPPVAVTLLCAFPRGGRGDGLVEKATELGVARLVPLEGARSVLHAGAGRLARWRRVAIEAAEQCGRAVVPAIGDAPSPAAAPALALVADADGPLTIREALAHAGNLAAAAAGSGIALYVGPEGGWSDQERVAHAHAGRRFVTLGPRTLRVETAAVLGAAQLLEATGGLARP